MRIDYQDEVRLDHTVYSVVAQTVDGTNGPKVMLRLQGGAEDGTLHAEGHLQLPVADIDGVAWFLHQVLAGLAQLNGAATAPKVSRPRPANANQPWTQEQDTRLRDAWLAATDPMTAATLLPELVAQFGRSKSAIRARLARIGCDPDIAGRELATAQSEVMPTS